MKVAWAGLTWAALLVGVQATASAQAGWSLIPSFSLAEEFDDNVFVTSTAKKSDFITRFTPGIDLGPAGHQADGHRRAGQWRIRLQRGAV